MLHNFAKKRSYNKYLHVKSVGGGGGYFLPHSLLWVNLKLIIQFYFNIFLKSLRRITRIAPRG